MSVPTLWKGLGAVSFPGFDASGFMSNLDAEELLRESRERADKAQKIQRDIADLVGRAETPDGRIRVSCKPREGVDQLEIDPRAMRLSSTELADTIKSLIRQARQDLDRQTEKIVGDAYGEGGDPREILKNKEDIQEMVDGFQNVFANATQNANSMLDQIRQTLGLGDTGRGAPDSRGPGNDGPRGPGGR